MDTVNINNQNQMAQYDFNKPINVTIIFEDGDEVSSYQKAFEKQIQGDDNKLRTQKPEDSNIQFEITENIILITDEIKEEDVIIEHRIKNNVTDVKENMKATNTINHMPDINITDQDMEHTNTQNPSTIQNTTCDTVDKDNSNVVDHQNENSHELDDYIDALLNVVSENLILIIRPYHYYYRKNAAVTENIVKYLDKLKIHFFDLSYSTVVSLILPHEQNKKFIKAFIDNTVAIANNVLTWKCNHRDVEPFYYEMIIWAKKKRDQIRKLKSQSKYNPTTHNGKTQENRILKEHLANPPKFPAAPQKNTSKNITAPSNGSAVNPANQTINSENRKCILSAGPPGREITINIDPAVLHAHNNQYTNNNNQQNHGYDLYKNTDNYTPNVTVDSRQAHYNYNVNHQQSYPQTTVHYNRSPPRSLPPSYESHNYNTSFAHSVHTHHSQESIPQNIRNCQTQRNYNQFVAPFHNNPNYGQMYNTHHTEAQVTPIISSIVSLNGRCCICGKSSLDTRSRCSKCNKPVYCSFLCQELDAGSHITLCGKT